MSKRELSERDTGRRWRPAHALLLAALLLGGMRWVRLGDWSLWYDEAITWADAHHAAEGQLYNPAGYFLIRRTVEWLGGVADEFSLRFLPAVAGWLAIPLTYWAFAGVAGRRRAALAALLVAVSPWQLYWSQNARFYTMAQALGLGAAGLVLRAYFVERQTPAGRYGRIAGGAVLLALAAQFQLQGALLLLALLAAPLVSGALGCGLRGSGRRAARVVLGVAVLGGLAMAPWVLEAWETYALKKSVGSVPGRLAHFGLSTGFYVSPLWAAGFALGALGAWLARDRFFVFATLVVVIGVAAAGLASLKARVTAQYVFAFSPWIALVAAWPLGILWPAELNARSDARSARLLRYGYGLLLVAPTLASSVLYLTVRYGERPRWREAYEYVWNHHEAEDLILGMVAPVGEFYLAPGATDLRHPRQVAWLDGFRWETPHHWARHDRRTWMILRPDYLEDWPEAEREAMRRMLREECRLAQSFPVVVEGRGLSVEVYVRDGS